MAQPRSRLVDFWQTARSSFWLVPTAMSVLSALLAAVLIALERALAPAGDTSPWFDAFGAEAASLVLSTIAASMITVAGVVVSVTIVALQLASTQFGPRLLRSFMIDPGNQIAIGTFIASFTYCLLVLGSIRHGEAGFVPQIATMGGMALGMADIAATIYFIHHITREMRVENVIAAITDELLATIDAYFLDDIGAPPTPGADPPALPRDFETGCRRIAAGQSGYIRHADGRALLELVTAHDLVVRLDRRPGDFVVADTCVMSVWPAERVDEQLVETLRAGFSLGPERTPLQDPEFGLRQIVEVALRALSPSLNDPFTAIACIDRMGQVLCRLVDRPQPQAWRCDDTGRLRLVAVIPSVPEVVIEAVSPLAATSLGHAEVVIALLRMLALVASHSRDETAQRTLTTLAQDLAEDAQARLVRGSDQARVHDALAAHFYQRSLISTDAPIGVVRGT